MSEPPAPMENSGVVLSTCDHGIGQKGSWMPGEPTGQASLTKRASFQLGERPCLKEIRWTVTENPDLLRAHSHIQKCAPKREGGRDERRKREGEREIKK